MTKAAQSCTPTPVPPGLSQLRLFSTKKGFMKELPQGKRFALPGECVRMGQRCPSPSQSNRPARGAGTELAAAAGAKGDGL